MKIQVIYSSLSGCTKKLAQGIYDGLGDAENPFMTWRRENPPWTATSSCWATGWTKAAPTPR